MSDPMAIKNSIFPGPYEVLELDPWEVQEHDIIISIPRTIRERSDLTDYQKSLHTKIVGIVTGTGAGTSIWVVTPWEEDNDGSERLMYDIVSLKGEVNRISVVRLKKEI